jgi:hypothetical protein
MPRKRRPFAPLAPLAPLALMPFALLLLPRIKLNLTSIAFILFANTLKLSYIPFKSLAIISTLTPCLKIDILKSKKPKIEPLVKIVSYSIEFYIYLDEVKRITQAFLVNILIRVRKTS